jgi:hypothetical protein
MGAAAVMQTGGYFGLVKHAEQVRYVPREALGKTPFWIAFWGGFDGRKTRVTSGSLCRNRMFTGV